MNNEMLTYQSNESKNKNIIFELCNKLIVFLKLVGKLVNLGAVPHTS